MRRVALQHHILCAMLGGAVLKALRTLDGAEIHILKPAEGGAELPDGTAIEGLKQTGLIASNMKFPAATYLLTEQGVAAATALMS